MIQQHRWPRLIPALVIATAFVTAAHAQNSQQNVADADRLVKTMDVKAGSVIAEIGAGAGELTIALARVVGPTGRIYSNELNIERLAAIRKAAEDAGLANVTTI